MNMMLLCIKHSTKIAKKLPRDVNKNVLKESIIINNREDAEEHDILLELEGIDTDGKKKKYIIIKKLNMNSLFLSSYNFSIRRNITLPIKKSNSFTDFAVLVLLSKISRKIGILFGMSNFDLEQEKEDRARDLYQTYISNYSSNLIFGTGEEEPIGKYYYIFYTFLSNIPMIFYSIDIHINHTILQDYWLNMRRLTSPFRREQTSNSVADKL